MASKPGDRRTPGTAAWSALTQARTSGSSPIHTTIPDSRPRLHESYSIRALLRWAELGAAARLQRPQLRAVAGRHGGGRREGQPRAGAD
jgi:hypothetical protein